VNNVMHKNVQTFYLFAYVLNCSRISSYCLSSIQMLVNELLIDE